MLQRAASNAYSWWWASHIRTKQSKWLDNHLQDMEHRVKCMLLLLGEEADSFSKRAEMYYKRRPEVITQVEEVYRAYRALADRYDIMSGELHKANHTIATAFPDQVQYAMLEEEDDNIPKAFTPVDPRKIHKSTVDGLMKKKKGEHGGSMGGGAKNSTSAPPINKENAGEEISRLQKSILVMQTEKEFIKSSYESGIAKYWDLEKEINEMQEQVCHFQDKFDESAVIEDDEARALMTATALKSCEDTIIKLQEQRMASAGQAVGESERVKVFREKLEAIMKKHGKSLPDPLDLSDKNTRKSHGAEMEDVYHLKQGAIETRAVIDKIKEHFEKDCNISMAEVTERIDELVNNVVDLELMVSSQTSQIDRLCRENTELENSLKSLDDENTAADSGSSELNEKLRQVEEDLVRVQALENSFHKDESTIRSNFVEAISRFSDLSDLLLSPVCEQEQHAGSASAETTHEAPPAVESTEPVSSSERCEDDVKPQQIAEEPHAADNNAGPAVKPEEPDGDALVVAGTTDESSGSTNSSSEQQQVDVGQDKSSRERGSLLARLRHISSDNLGGGYDGQPQEEMGSKVVVDSSSSATDMMKLQERLADSLEDKEKVLLGEYTSLLEDYKDAKRRLAEMEKTNQECLKEIRSLREEMASSAGEGGAGSEGSCRGIYSRRGHRRTPSYSSLHQRRPSVSSLSRLIRMSSTIQPHEEARGDPAAADHQQGGGAPFNLEDLRLPAVAAAENASPLEEKFRRDIDTLLDENLEFWMKFSSSLQRVQEFQSKHEGLQRKLQLINNEDAAKQDGSTEKQLRAFKTELQVWSEQNAMLRGELQCRFTSLCDIQEEITAALETEADAAAAQFMSYQAGKFQGEVLNMQQENNRVSDELQAGLDHVKGLQAEVEQALAKLHRSVSLPAQPTHGADHYEDSSSSAHGGNMGRPPSNKSKAVPLQSFLFPAKKKKTSLLARVTPVLQKQQAEMKFLVKLPR
ncbi:protein NETWORKED 2D-like [Panicum miliaceum]|uniref:Protein NETWORKED 2D-like n=1 Tax=Panicum miliaceum TaxID=4540 RepID=A0A3L6PM84_PANMI|nr:protein NETWORKED 2D-like [Panicum miliaceum]